MVSRPNVTHATDSSANEDAEVKYNIDGTYSIRRFEQREQHALSIPSWFVVQLTITASLGGCLFGYDMGAISGTLPKLTTTFDLDDRQKELVVSILYVGGAVGGSIGGSLCDRIGRKLTIMLTDIVFIVGALLLYFASVYTEIVIGRFVVGVGVAVSGVADVSYLHECSPIAWRGSIVSVNEACISLGFLLAYIAGYAFADEGAEEWRVVFGVAGILAAVQFIGMSVLPESPAWLTEKGKIDDAKRALERINGTNHNIDTNVNGNADKAESSLEWHPSNRGPNFVGNEKGNINSKSPLREYDLANEETRQRNSGIQINPRGKNSLGSVREEPTGIYRSSDHSVYFSASRCHVLCAKIQATKLMLSRYRHQVYIAIFLSVAQQFCGQTNILSYAPMIFAEAMNHDTEDENSIDVDDNVAGETKDLSMIIIGLVKFFVTVIVIWRIEYIGRRFLLIFGNLLIATGLLALVIAFGGSSNSADGDDDVGKAVTSWSPLTNIKSFHLALPGVILVVCGYSLSFGPLTWLLTSELFPTEVRGRALGYSTIISYMCGAISTETFLFTQSILGPSFVFGIYCIITVAGLLFVYLAIPDTGAKTAQQIDESLRRMYWWKYSAIALSQDDEDCLHDGPTCSSDSEMVRNPSQQSVHVLI